jgi:outer membrane protein assembly factor BamB
MAHAVLTLGALACGSRTGLDVGVGLDGGESTDVTRSVDALADTGLDTTHHADSTPPDGPGIARDGGNEPFDCPFAVLAGSPQPMFANCSTRDGRSRVVGPKSPQVTWTTMLPGNAAVAAGVSLVADASNNVYATSSLASMAWMAKVEGASGMVDWSTPFASVAAGAPLLVASGKLLDYATTPSFVAGTFDLLVESFAPAFGAFTTKSIGPLANGIGLPAVGADGSLYVGYGEPQAQMFFGVIARILPDGQVGWTSPNLTSPMAPDSSGISAVALGAFGLVVVGVEPSSGMGSVVALDAGQGAVTWTMMLDSSPSGSPAVAPDGSIAIVSKLGTLYVLDPSEGQIRVTKSIGMGEFINAIALDGTLIVGGTTFLAIGPAGEALWSSSTPHFVSATIDAAGTVVATFGDHIEGLDLATGATRWSVAAPDAVPCIGGATLTSAGGIVAIGCVDFMEPDGEVFAFGASDPER